MEVIVHKNVMNAENNIFDYTSVPPPPYTKSSVGSSSSFNTFNRVIFFSGTEKLMIKNTHLLVFQCTFMHAAKASNKNKRSIIDLTKKCIKCQRLYFKVQFLI